MTPVEKLLREQLQETQAKLDIKMHEVDLLEQVAVKLEQALCNHLSKWKIGQKLLHIPTDEVLKLEYVERVGANLPAGKEDSIVYYCLCARTGEVFEAVKEEDLRATK